MSHNFALEAAARRRISANASEIRHSVQMVREGRPRAAETERKRLINRLMAEKSVSLAEARALADELMSKKGGREVIQGDTVDFDGIFFFKRGLRAARSVARVRTPTGFGTGFMVSHDLFVTNNHVIDSHTAAARSVIEFDVEVDEDGSFRSPTVFTLDPGRFFCTDDVSGLDFTLVAVGPRKSGSGNLQSFGYCELSDASNKHSLGEMANIIQHPGGKPKQVVVRENRLAARTNDMLHYLADTLPGSSGSPVFNGQWQVIALHHFGGPSQDDMRDENGKPIPLNVNEGIRSSAIVGFLKKNASLGKFTPQQIDLLKAGVNQPPWREEQLAAEAKAGTGMSAPKLADDGTATWRIPLEISVRIPMAVGPSPDARPAPANLNDGDPNGQAGPMGGSEALRPDDEYDAREGYDTGFLGGTDIGLPELGKAAKSDAALLQGSSKARPKYELKYHHFSVVMNGARKLAFFTACNIDGKTAIDLKRKEAYAMQAEGIAAEGMAEGMEASEKWYLDPRIAAEDQTPQTLYDAQITPKGAAGGHIANIFQRGHLVRRLDPVWGDPRMAKDVEADTFHFTNCTPQIGFFNMGKGNKRLAGTGGGRLWRALEDYVLDNAKAEGRRVCVFTGPVFGDKDIPWRQDVIEDFRVPLKFWKVVAWKEGKEVKARALLADQSVALPKVLPEAFGPEAFDDTEPVADFITSLAEIEALTGLSFPAAVKKGDLGKGEKRAREARKLSEILKAG